MSDLARLETALELTERMLETARAQDWERLTDLEAARRQHLQEAFTGKVSGAEAPAFAALAQQILALDRELIAAGEQERVTLGEALARLESGRRAKRAYAAAR